MTMNLTLQKQDITHRQQNRTNKLQRQIEACSDIELERIETTLTQKAQAGAERKTVKLLQYCCSLRRTGRAFSGDEAMMFVYDAVSGASTGQLRRLMTYLLKTIAALHSETPPNPQDLQLEAETLMNKALYADAVKTLRRWLKAAEDEERLLVIPEIYRKLIRCHVARLDDKPLDDLLAALHHAQLQADFHAAFHNTLARFIALKAQKKTTEIQSCLKIMRDLSGKLHHCDYAQVMTAMLCGNHLLHTGDAATAKSHYESALEIAKLSRSAEVDADVRFKLDVNLAGAYSVLGQYEAALERYRSVLRSPYSRHNLTVLENASLAAMMAENYIDAENFARRAIVIAEQTENRFGAAKPYLTLAQCQIITGAYSAAMMSLEKAERIAKHKEILCKPEVMEAVKFYELKIHYLRGNLDVVSHLYTRSKYFYRTFAAEGKLKNLVEAVFYCAQSRRTPKETYRVKLRHLAETLCKQWDKLPPCEEIWMKAELARFGVRL